ncbi:MAG: ribbon-helix-helix domain-containing protein [Actinopolymorphaceae bacterium]
MKLSVSLSEEDVAFLDDYASRTGAPSRSSVIHEAVKTLQLTALEAAYSEAGDEWIDSEAAWDSTAGDGIRDASR